MASKQHIILLCSQIAVGHLAFWLTHQLCQEIIFHVVQEFLTLFLLCCIVFQSGYGSVHPLSSSGFFTVNLVSASLLWFTGQRLQKQTVPRILLKVGGQMKGKFYWPQMKSFQHELTCSST